MIENIISHKENPNWKPQKLFSENHYAEFLLPPPLETSFIREVFWVFIFCIFLSIKKEMLSRKCDRNVFVITYVYMSCDGWMGNLPIGSDIWNLISQLEVLFGDIMELLVRGDFQRQAWHWERALRGYSLTSMAAPSLSFSLCLPLCGYMWLVSFQVMLPRLLPCQSFPAWRLHSSGGLSYNNAFLFKVDFGPIILLQQQQSN